MTTESIGGCRIGSGWFGRSEDNSFRFEFQTNLVIPTLLAKVCLKVGSLVFNIKPDLVGICSESSKVGGNIASLLQNSLGFVNIRPMFSKRKVFTGATTIRDISMANSTEMDSKCSVEECFLVELVVEFEHG